MRSWILVFVCSASCLNSLAQQVTEDGPVTEGRRRFISLSFGASFPLGLFRAQNSYNLGNGFAASGIHYQVEYAGFWMKHVGFGVQVGAFNNALNANAYTRDFSTALNAVYPITPGLSLKTTDPTSWKSNYIMTGPYFRLPMKDLVIDFKALGGVLICSTPGHSYSVRNTFTFPVTTVINDNVPSVSATAFAYELGMNARLKVSPGTQIRFGLEYLQSYVDEGQQARSGPGGNSFAWGGFQSVAVLNLSWGISFRLK